MMLGIAVVLMMILLIDMSSVDAFHVATGTTTRTASSSTMLFVTPDNVDNSVAIDKATKAMTAFTNKYLELSCTKLCSDKSIPAVVIKGLAEHKVTLGAPLCPCRFYDNKELEAKDGYWNCPCVPMRERRECHCMLFLTDDNEFVGTEKIINYDEVIELSSSM